MKKYILLIIIALANGLYSNTVNSDRDFIFSVKGNFLKYSFSNDAGEKYNFESKDTNLSLEPSLNLFSINDKRSLHFYFDWKGKKIDSNVEFSVNENENQYIEADNLLSYNDDVEIRLSNFNFGFQKRGFVSTVPINYLDLNVKINEYESDYKTSPVLNSDLSVSYLTIELGHVFNHISNSDHFFASTRKNEISEYFLYEKNNNLEYEFYLAPHIEVNSIYTTYYEDYGEPDLYEYEDKFGHLSFGLNLESRVVHRKDNFIAGFRLALLNGIVYKDFWNNEDLPYDLRGDLEIFSNILYDNLIFTSRFKVENENSFLSSISFTRVDYEFFNEITIHRKKKIFFSLNYTYSDREYVNCTSSHLFVTQMDQIPEKLLSKKIKATKVGMNVKFVF